MRKKEAKEAKKAPEVQKEKSPWTNWKVWVAAVIIVAVVYNLLGGGKSSESESVADSGFDEAVTEVIENEEPDDVEVIVEGDNGFPGWATPMLDEEGNPMIDEYGEVYENYTFTNPTFKMRFGEFLEANANNAARDDGAPIVVIKAKIKSSYNDDATISNNFFNVEDVIKNQGGDQYEEIQYWAVMDTDTGSEVKVISFTIDKELIDMIKEGKIPAAYLNDYFTDENEYFLHPSFLHSERAEGAQNYLGF